MSRDPADNYLIALGEQCKALLVSGGKDLLSLSEAITVLSPAGFYEFLQNMDLV